MSKPILVLRTKSQLTAQQYDACVKSLQDHSVYEDYHVLLLDGDMVAEIVEPKPTQ